MTFALAALAVVMLVALVAVAVMWKRSHRGLMAERLRRKVLVTLKSGDGFSGVLFSADRDCLVLREAVAVAYGPRSESVPVGGELLILRADVAYMQLP